MVEERDVSNDDVEKPSVDEDGTARRVARVTSGRTGILKALFLFDRLGRGAVKFGAANAGFTDDRSRPQKKLCGLDVEAMA